MTERREGAAGTSRSRLRLMASVVMLAGLVAVGCSDDDDDAAPVAVVPARDGSYRYVVTKTRTTKGSKPAKTTAPVTTRIRTRSRASGDVRQTLTTGQEKAELALRPDGQYVLSDNYRELPAQCSWTPAVLAFRLPLKTGATWTVDSTCTSGPITVHHTESARVTGTKRVKAGDTVVAAWVVERSGTTKYSTPERSIELDNSTIQLFSPRYGLVVRSTVKNTTTTPQGQVLTTETEQVLQSVTPR